MLDNTEPLILGFAVFGIVTLILAMVIRRRHGRRSSVISILPSEPAKPPSQNQSGPSGGSGRSTQ